MAQPKKQTEMSNKENISVENTYIDRLQQIKRPLLNTKNFKESSFATSTSSLSSSLKKLTVQPLAENKAFKIENEKNTKSAADVAAAKRAVIKQSVPKDSNLYKYAEQQRKHKEELIKKKELEEKAEMKVCYMLLYLLHDFVTLC